MERSDFLLCVCIFCSGLLAFTFNSFYGCTDVSNDTWLMFAVDVYRLTSTLILMLAVYLNVNKIAELTKNYSVLFGIFALGALTCFLVHVIKLSETRTSNYCLMKNTGETEWNLELQKIFDNSDFCLIDNNVRNPTFSMENPYHMSNAKSWCKERIEQRCVNRNFKYNDISNCLRHGATDFVPHVRYLYIFDLIGDISRFLLCLHFALRKNTAEKAFTNSFLQPPRTVTEKFRL